MSATAFNDIRYKASSGQINLDEAQGIVECFVAGIGNKDSVGDVCSSGAFTKSLMRRKPRVVWGHNWNDPIGKVLEIYEVSPSDPRLPGKMRAAGIGGLYARVQFNLNSEKGKEAFANVAFFGEDQEWSIGYKTIRAQFDQASQANILNEVELYEVSPVLHGANQLTGTISIKTDDVSMNSFSSAMALSDDEQSPNESNMRLKIEAELATRLGTSIKVASMSEGVVHFTRTEQDGKSSMYKCRFSYGNDGVFMFGRPELVSPPVQTRPSGMPMTRPVEMPSTMPMGQRRPQAGVPTPPGQTIVVPSTLPGATPSSPPLVRVNYQQPPEPIGIPKLIPEERDLAEALVTIANRYGKFNEDSTGIYAAYTPAAENPVAKIGVVCANCVLYKGGSECKIIDKAVEPGGKCRFAVIPDNVVSANPISRMKLDSYATEQEVDWLEDIEAKYPGEFVSGRLRKIIKKRYKKRSSQKNIELLANFEEKSFENFINLDDSIIDYYIPVSINDAFEIKQILDPILNYYMVDSYVEDGGIIFTNGVTKDFVDAVSAALKGLDNHPFPQSEKALGQSIGSGGNLAGRVSRATAVFNPNAWDGDNDGLVQEGTPFQRPSIPGVNDFGTGGNVNSERALEAYVNGQGGEVSTTGQILPSRRTIGATADDAKKPLDMSRGNTRAERSGFASGGTGLSSGNVDYDSAFRRNGWKKDGDKWKKGNWEIEASGPNGLSARNTRDGEGVEQDKGESVSALRHLNQFERILRGSDDANFDDEDSEDEDEDDGLTAKQRAAEKERMAAYLEFSKITTEEMALRTERAEAFKERARSPEYMEERRIARVARNKGKETNLFNADGTIKKKPSLSSGNRLSSGNADNKWNGKQPSRKDIKPRANLSGADLRYILSLDGENLSGANMQNANLDKVFLKNANLSRANMQNANLENVILKNANLSGAILTDANLDDAYLENVNLEGAQLNGAYLIKAKIYDANMSEANLADANLSRAKLSRAKLTNANLSEAKLRYADFSGADLRGADLSYANLIDTNFDGADLQGADLSGTHLAASLIGADLTGANLTDAYLWEVKFEGLDLTGAIGVNPDFLKFAKEKGLSSGGGKAPSYPRAPTLGAFLGAAEERFGGASSWDEFKEIYKDTEMVFLDYETTGLNFDGYGQATSNGNPTQIGLVRVKNGKEIGRLNLFMNPEEPLGDWSAKNLKDESGNRLTNEWLATQMSMEEAHRQVAEFIGPEAIIGVQNATFDKNVLDDALAREGIDWSPSGYLDTRDISAMTLPVWSEENQDGPYIIDKNGNKKPSSSLGAITQYLDVDLGDGHHNADADALATSQVMQKIIDRAIENDWPTDVLSKEKRDEKLDSENKKFESDVVAFEKEKIDFIKNGLSSGSDKDFLPQSDSKRNSEKGKEKLTPEQMWEEGILGFTLDDLAERTGMARQEVRKAQLDFIKSNSKDPEFRNRENDLRVHAEYMAQMEKLGIYPPGNPDYYSGSKDEKMAKAREAASQVGLSVEEASAEADPRYWDYLTNKGTTSRLGLSSGKGGETPGERNNRQIYERRVTTGESLDDVANALGMTREDVRRSEMLHAKRLRDESLRMSLKDETPREKRDREIFDRRSASGISIDALAEETGMSRSDIRQAEMRHASRLRNEPLSQRDERKNRLSSGRIASDGGKMKPKSNPENVKKKASKDRQKLSSGESLDWSNPSDGLPSNMDNWTDNDWETYRSRRYVQRERRGSRPYGKALSNGLREEIGDSILPSKDGSPRYGGHTSDKGYASVGKDKDGTWSASRFLFDDWVGYHTNDYDYDEAYEQSGFDTPEEASDWLAGKIEEDGAYIYGDKKRDDIAAGRVDDSAREEAWAKYYRESNNARLQGENGDEPNDVIRFQPGLSSGKSPYQMGGRIAAQVNKKMPPRTNYDYSPDGDKMPTAEQKMVIDAVMTGANVLVPALAGSGKTSTLVSLAKRIKKEKPDTKMLYLAFNTSAAKDAKRRFVGLENNVEVVTLDAIGKRWIEESRGKIGKRFSSRINIIHKQEKKKNPNAVENFVALNGRDIAKQLGLKSQVVNGKEISGSDIAKLAIKAVEKFEISSDGSIGLQHFLDSDNVLISPDAMPGNILEIANMHWKDKSGDDGMSLITFNTLNKMWALSGPDFSEAGSGAQGAKDLVLYDESQDLNPVWNAAAAGQSVQNVFVGDPNQAIYGFRGAVNEMDSIAERSEYVLPITEVFRFGPEIAGYVNRVLAILGIEENRMVGRGKSGEVVEPGTMTDATGYLSRTNAGVIRAALEEIDRGRTVATTKNAKTEVDQTIKSIKKLRFNVPTNDGHPDLEEFETWKEFEDSITKGTATRKQESLYRMMNNISLTDLQRVSEELQVWDPSAGDDTELPEDLLDGANFPNGISFASDKGVIYLSGNTFENKTSIGKTGGFTFNRGTKRWELNPGSDEKRRGILLAVRDISSFAQGKNDKSVPRLKMPDSLDVRGTLGGDVNYEISGSSIALTGNTYNMGTILRANGFSFDKDAKKWKNNTTRSEAERKSILESIVKQSIRESDAANLASAKQSSGRPDVVVTTAHQAKGLEFGRVKLGGDWWGPKKDKITGETVWPDEEHINALYVALSRPMEALDPGSASWITDWTDDNDELSNTRGGLSSGKARRTKGQLATRRPWSEEERQAFAGGQRQRAQTVPGKRKEGPSAGEFGPGTNRRDRRLSSGGLSSGGNFGGIGFTESGIVVDTGLGRNNTIDNPKNMRRRAVGGNVGGIGTIGEREKTKKTFLPFEDGELNAKFRNNLKNIIGGSRWKPTIGKLETNKQSDGKTLWQLEASKVLELFKDGDGRQLSDDEILTALGYISKSTKPEEAPRNKEEGVRLLAALRRPGASISEGDAAAILEAIYPEDDTLSTPGNERAREVWGFASSPRWLRQDGTSVSQAEFDSMSAKEIGKLSPDLGDFDFELPSGDFEPPAPKTVKQKSIGGRPLVEVNKKENFTADKLFDYLGIGKSDMSKSERAKLAVEVLKNEHNIQVSAKTVSEQWFKGISTDVIQHLLDTGKIPSVSEVFGEQNSSFEQYPTALSAKRRVFDSLLESGISESQAEAIFGQIFGGGTQYQGMLDSEQKMANYRSGKIPFAGSGTVVKYDENKLGEIVDALNEARAKNGADPVDAGALFGIKETVQAAAPKPSAPRAAPEAKPKGALLEKFPEITKWEKLDRDGAKKLSDAELEEASSVLYELSNPTVKKGNDGDSFPDGLKPSDERVIKAKRMLQIIEKEAEARAEALDSASESKIRDEIEAQYDWRLPTDGLPKNFSDWTTQDRATFSERMEIEKRMGIKTAWSGVSIRTKGDRAQRYKIV